MFAEHRGKGRCKIKKPVAAVIAGVIVVASILLAIKLNGPIQSFSPPPTVVVPAPVQVEYLAEPPEGALVFDMKYHGLSGDDDALAYHSYWGYGGSSDRQSKFITSLKKKIPDIHPVYNPNFKGAEWAGVECAGSDVLALYFDLNADGKLSGDEKILPAEQSGDGSEGVDFVTPDFTMKTQDNRKVPFRVLLQVRFYSGSSRPNCMWSPACVLKGGGKIGEDDIEAVLSSDGFKGAFDQFGRNSFSLVVNEEEGRNYVTEQTLSSLMNYKGTFYRLHFCEGDANDIVCRVALVEDTTPTGKLAVNLVGEEELKARLSSATINGGSDTTVNFSVSNGQSEFPQGDYVLSRGYVYFNREGESEWSVDFTKGPEIAIEADKTLALELGKPTISVSAVEANKKYASNVQEQSVYKKGIKIHLSPEVIGAAGERYGRFRQKKDNRYIDIEPTIRIVDEDGKELVSQTMEYG